MEDEVLQDKAVEFVSGVMTTTEHDSFEVVLEYRSDLRRLVADLTEVAASVTLATRPLREAPPAALKDRIFAQLDHAGPRRPDGLVVTDPQGQIEWVNAGFTAMCGYSLDELRGRKPGAVLQGPATDPAVVNRIRAALADRRDCEETLVNYHKDGSRYRATVRIGAVRDREGAPLWLVAQEWRLPE